MYKSDFSAGSMAISKEVRITSSFVVELEINIKVQNNALW
jgi:hypothetical protein